MPRCPTIKENLTAWIDGELSVGWSERIEQHLARCPSCSDEARHLRGSVELQRRLLPQLVGASASDADRLFASVRRRIAAAGADEEPERWWRRVSWTGLLRPLPMAAVAAVLLLVTLVEVAGGPDDVLIPVGVKAPPAVVSHKPGMFRDYAIIEELDALENFDTVEVEPLDDDQVSERG